MPFQIYNNSTQMAQFVVLVIFTPLSVLVTALRFVASRKGKRKLGMEDWFCVLATIFTVMCNVCALMGLCTFSTYFTFCRTDARQPSRCSTAAASSTKSSRRRKTTRPCARYALINSIFILRRERHANEAGDLQWDMAGLYMFFGHILFVKLAILALYRRIFGVNRSYLISIYVLATVQVLLVIVFCVFQALQCKPFGRYFDLRIHGTCTSEGVVVLGGGLPDSLVDFAAVVLAMWMIKSLQISTKIKWRLRMLFGVGFVYVPALALPQICTRLTRLQGRYHWLHQDCHYLLHRRRLYVAHLPLQQFLLANCTHHSRPQHGLAHVGRPDVPLSALRLRARLPSHPTYR